MANTRDSITDVWGARTPFHGRGNWPERTDERTLETPDGWVQSACVLCSNGCALDIGVKDGRIVGVRGRASDVINRGRLGPKGLHAWEANHSEDRLTEPLIRRRGKLVPATWEEAMTAIVSKARHVKEHYSASAIGFYTSGQLFLEEYYTLSVIGKAGLGTPHMDGNTRLCTATAADALKETFGADGQPGSYYDVDDTDCLLLVGHNPASTATVLWMRMLDRRRGPNPPKLIVIDPRATATAKEADLHLAPKLGTNVAVLNGLLHLVIEGGYVDREFVAEHTVGFDSLKAIVEEYTPEHVESLAGVPAADLREAARMIGESRTLLSTCLQGVYQSNQATAAAIQVNNLNLILGRIARPGSGILQMNGQPTSQNTRETGADGDLPGFRNWENAHHIAELAALWNVDTKIIPHWTPPTHAMQILRHCETGSIRMLWVQATNPAVSLPHLDRVRHALEHGDLFLVVQDAFLTETAQLAHVVLPAAIWGEKTGCFTNADRTVHLSRKAVEPPGEARSDFDIFLDFAHRMDFRDKDGAPLIKWRTPEEAFEAWKECSRGRPCDYTGLSYEKLSGGSGVHWPCNADHPDGESNLYRTLQFPTDPEECETYGHDLMTGALISPEQYRALNPAGRAILKGAPYHPPAEEPDEEFPYYLTTGRLVYHFHTRTKTARSPALAEAARDESLQISARDAEKLGIGEGDWVRVRSRRGVVEARAHIGDIEPGQVFLPFHYGYWDAPGRARAANELTIFEWDPVSKQPHFKYAAVHLERVASPRTSEPERVARNADQAAEPSARSLAKAVVQGAKNAVQSAKPVRSHVPDYIGLLKAGEERLVKAFTQVRETYSDEPDIVLMCKLFASWSDRSANELDPYVARYGKRREGEPGRLGAALEFKRPPGGFHMVRDLHDLWLLVNESVISIDVLSQAARGMHDLEFERTLLAITERNQRQANWLRTRIRQAAPQALIVPS